MKLKKFLKIILLIIILNFSISSFAYEEEPDEWSYIWLDEAIQESKSIAEPTILSKYAIVYDRTSGEILWGKNENTPVPMASTTKIMTALVMLEQLGTERLTEQVEICKEAAATIGSRLGLKTGDKITYNDLLYGLMLCSGNDAAVQIAISISGSVENFVELMNIKAIQMGLENTNFVTPHGLDKDEHYTTAFELAKITDYALNNSQIAEVVKTKDYTVTINGYPKAISNTNELLGYLKGVDGVKTGYTSKAGRCLVTSVNREDFEIITVVLGADTRKIRTQDSIKLIEYIYNNYQLINIEELVQNQYEAWCQINQKRIIINKGIKSNPEIYIETGKYTKYPIKQNESIVLKTTVITEFEAPVAQGTEVGKIIVKKGEDIIEEIPIKIKETVNKKNILNYFFEIIRILKMVL